MLLEAGNDVVPGHEPADIRNIFPLSSFNERYTWPDTLVHWGTRSTSPRSRLPQGKILGGSSTIMGMWALRGHPDDYDGWQRAGATGWDWTGVLPYFNKLETDHDFGGDRHGRSGPLPIRRESVAEHGPLACALHAIARRHGWADVADMNADFRDGHCAVPVSRTVDGRSSAGLAYLTRAVRDRRNLQVLTGHEVKGLLVDGNRVVGVTASNAKSEKRCLKSGLVILAAGALRTPVLLMQSGIGPGEQLRLAGIPVLHNLPGVGQNLQNHAVLHLVGMLAKAGRDPPGFRPAGSTCLRWTSGLPGTSPADMSLAARSRLSWHALGQRMASLSPCLMRPASTGQITLSAARHPVIEFNLLSDARDIDRMTSAVRFALSLFSELTEAGVIGPPLMMTEAERLMRYNHLSKRNAVRALVAAAALTIVPPLGQRMLHRLARLSPARALLSDECQLDAFVRTASGVGHVCGTCRMGSPGDPTTVVDPAGKVCGIDGLIAADASIMPCVPAANTHLPTIMVAEKIAAGLLGRLSI